jgi:DNA topoisomerase-2
MKALKKKNKSGVDVKANIVKANTCISVNCLIENPTCDSQTKDNLTSRPKNFGSKCELPDKFLKALDKSGIIEAIIANATFKAQKGMKKLSGTKKTKIKGIPKVSPSERGRSEHKEEVR